MRAAELSAPERAPGADGHGPPPEPPRPHRHRVRTAFGVLVSLVSLAAVVWWASRQDAPRFPTAAGDLALVGTAVLVYALATLVRAWRWHGVLRRAHVEHRALDAYALVPVGYMGNTVLPARGGEVLRILLLADRSSARRREILGSILSERVLDATTLVALFVGLTALGVGHTRTGADFAVAGGAGLVAGAVGLWAYLRLRRRGHFERFAAAVRPVVRAGKPLLGPAGLLLGGATVAVWLMEGVIFWLVGQSLGLEMSIVEGCFVLVLTSFFSLVPAAPGYVGTFEAAVAFGLGALGVAGGEAVAYALLVRFVVFVPITAVGLVLLVGRYGGVRQLRRAEAEDAGAEG